MQDKFNPSAIKAIIGLGNPGTEYDNTYHNAGAIFIDILSKIKPEKRFKKTNGFMNESGADVKKILRLLGARTQDLLLVHDDSDLELGQYKISYGSGSAGHNGVASVIDVLGTKDFWRLRIGIRNDKTTRQKAGGFVLKKIQLLDKKILLSVFSEIIQNELRPT
ncbi:MAG: hypothetical protein AAB617_01310 [Patescibacteria group bacterium]